MKVKSIYLIKGDKEFSEALLNLTSLAYSIRKGDPIKQVKHSDYRDYDLTFSEQKEMRLRYLRKELNKLMKKYLEVTAELGLGRKDCGYSEMLMDELDAAMYKMRKNIINVESLSEDTIVAKRFNIEDLKKIPINSLVVVDNINRFKIRDERTPSCYWYRSNNTWVDFGGDGRKHDTIDLIMMRDNLDFISAVKFLTQFGGF